MNDYFGEDLFFEIYSNIAVSAQAFQEEGKRKWLSEVVLTSAVTTVIITFLNSIISEAGKDVYASAKKYIFPNKATGYTCKSEYLIEILNSKYSKIKKNKDSISHSQIIIEKKLIEIGFSDNDSITISGKIIEYIEENI